MTQAQPKPIVIFIAHADDTEFTARILGKKDVRFLEYSDGMLADTPVNELREKFTAIIRELKPRIIMTWDPFASFEPHPDNPAIKLLDRNNYRPVVDKMARAMGARIGKPAGLEYAETFRIEKAGPASPRRFQPHAGLRRDARDVRSGL